MREEKRGASVKSIEETLAEVNSFLEERYPLKEITLDDGRTVEVCSAKVDGGSKAEIEAGRIGNITFVVERGRVVKEDSGFGVGGEGGAVLRVKHLGWNSELDSDYLQKGDILLVRRAKKDIAKFAVSVLDHESHSSDSQGLWNEFSVKPLLGGESWNMTDLRGGEYEVVGRVVRLESFFA